MNLPKISVNIPLVRGGDASIVLESLHKVHYPRELLEVIIVEGNHIAKQRNAALRCSTGDIIYLLDDDAIVAPDAMKFIAKAFMNRKVAAVGGPSVTPHTGGNYINQLIGMALETYFGAMRMRFRYSKQKRSQEGSEYNLIGANLALRKAAVLAVGGFDEAVIPNEETELLRRLREKGYQLRYIDKLFIYRYQRSSLIQLARQFYHYGRGRMKQIRKASSYTDLVFLLPIGFLLYLFFLPLSSHWLFFLPLSLYGMIGMLTAAKAALRYGRADLIATLTLIFPIIHLSYAFGLVWEILLLFSAPSGVVLTPEVLVRTIELPIFSET